MFCFLVAIYLALASPVSSQNSSAITCPDSFKYANATGAASFSLDGETVPGNASFVWLYSVFENKSNLAPANLWLGSPAGINLSSTTNELNACGIELSLPENTIERGQADDGLCEQTLDPTCVASLKLAAEEAGDAQMAGFGTGPNLSFVCQQIVSSIIDAMKNASCAPYFSDNGLTVGSAELTSGTCTLPAYPNVTFGGFLNIEDGLSTFPASDPYSAYDTAYRSVKAVLAVFMQPANRLQSSAHVVATQARMNCVRITNTTSSSRVAATLPSPTGVTFPNPLSGADIAGIVTGCVAGVAIITGLVYLFIRRRRRARHLDAAAQPRYDGTKGTERDGPWREPRFI
ncbi:hypothetical protein MMC26_006853 [Xylographa opegraphella]|nr:hypothetical protein [Xylographa opegraphella]